VSAEHEPKLRTLLGRADTVLTKCRLRSGRVLAALNESRTKGVAVAPTGDDVLPVMRTGESLELPYGPHGGHSQFSRATNLDVELLGLFRGWMESLHKVLTNITRLELTRQELVELSGDQSVLKVPVRWAAASAQDVDDLLETLARCLPAVGGWHHDALIAAMKSLKPS
jgi:hypothetical protein